MAIDINALINNVGLVADKDKSKKHFPMLFLIDVSGSMASPGDIDAVNDAMPLIFQAIAHPPATSPLHGRCLDVAIMSYSSGETTVMDWTVGANLPPSIAQFTTYGSTATARALNQALKLIGDRLRYYKSNAIKWGMPNIVHITDGGINDVQVGSPEWNTLKTRLNNLTGEADPENPLAAIVHLIGPNGYAGAGINTMMQLTGANSVFDIKTSASAVETIVKIVSQVASTISEPYGTKSAVDAVNAAVTDPNAGLAPRNTTSIV